eukprot:2555858-Ditylum_brightwellii.AAC.1
MPLQRKHYLYGRGQKNFICSTSFMGTSRRHHTSHTSISYVYSRVQFFQGKLYGDTLGMCHGSCCGVIGRSSSWCWCLLRCSSSWDLKTFNEMEVLGAVDKFSPNYFVGLRQCSPFNVLKVAQPILQLESAAAAHNDVLDATLDREIRWRAETTS